MVAAHCYSCGLFDSPLHTRWSQGVTVILGTLKVLLVSILRPHGLFGLLVLFTVQYRCTIFTLSNLLTDRTTMTETASYQPVNNLKPVATARSVSNTSRDEEVSSHQWLSLARPTWKVIETLCHTAARGQDWNRPKSNIWKVMACCWSFFVMGANDSASGVRPMQATWNSASLDPVY